MSAPAPVMLSSRYRLRANAERWTLGPWTVGGPRHHRFEKLQK
jgi:hypothetical protein